jgi:hypothetical protein
MGELRGGKGGGHVRERKGPGSGSVIKHGASLGQELKNTLQWNKELDLGVGSRRTSSLNFLCWQIPRRDWSPRRSPVLFEIHKSWEAFERRSRGFSQQQESTTTTRDTKAAG